MAIEVAITGNGKYAGARSNIGTYTVSEESTPVEASDRTGGVGRISFTAVDDPARLGSVLLLNDTLLLTDGDRGSTEGRINTLRGNDGILNVTADSRLGRLVVDKQAGPVNGTFADAINYYLGLAGITTGISIDSSLASIPVAAQGWIGDVWSKVKDLCVIYGAEPTLLKSTITFRPIRQRRALELNNMEVSWDISNVDLAKQVEVYYYGSTYKTNQLIYPKDGWNDDVRVYTVDSGQVLTVNIPVDISLVSVSQPTVQDTVDQTYGATSVYSVVGKDGVGIAASAWTAKGGNLSVAIGDDSKSLDVTITGMDDSDNSPYRIAVSTGPSDYYSSLRIVGTGLHYNRQSIIIPTGADDASTSRDVGVTIDNIYVNDYAQAMRIATDAAGKWSAPQRTVSLTKAYISKPGDTNPQFDYATFADFDAYATANSLTTFSQFDTAWSGQTFAQFDAYWYSIVQNDFRFQVFGNAAGARFQWRRGFYRIREANITESGVTATAEHDTTFSDFDTNAATFNAAMTFSDFDTLYSGLTFSDFALTPLPYARPEYDR